MGAAERLLEKPESTAPKGKGLAGGSLIYLLSNILTAALPFALLPVLTRYLTPTQYGEVAMFQTWLAALGAFTGLSVQGAAVRKYYDADLPHGELARFIGACLQILLASVLIIFLAVYFLKDILASVLDLKTDWIILAVAVSAATFVFQLRLEQWQIRQRALSYGAMQVAQALLALLLTLLLVVAFQWAADGRILAVSVSMLAFAGVAFFLLGKDGLLAVNRSWSRIREALAFGVPLIPHVAGAFLLTAVDRFVVNGQLGLTQAGLYMVAVQLSSVMLLVFDAINKAYIPWLYERLKRDIPAEKQAIVRYTYIYFAAVLILAGLAFPLGPFFITWIAGDAYADAGQAIGWLALGQAFGGMYFMVTNYIFYAKRTAMLSAVTITSGLVNVGLLLALIEPFGLTGAAQAYCCAMALRFCLTWAVAQRSHPMPWLAYRRFS